MFFISVRFLIDIRNLNLWKQKMSHFLYQECEFLISKIIISISDNHFLISQIRILEIRPWFFDIKKCLVLFRSDSFLLISEIWIFNNRKCLIFLYPECELHVSRIRFFDIRNHVFDITNSYSWNQTDFLISKNVWCYWYQTDFLLISGI